MLKQITASLMVFGVAAAVGCAAEAPEDEILTTQAFEQGLTCDTNAGINPMKAALAVAMAKEIGRLDPVNDLAVSNNVVVLTNGAMDACSGRGFVGCPNTDAILKMQQTSVNQYVPKTVFNAISFNEDLKASFDRQRNHEKNLVLNHPTRVPKAHTLWHKSITDYGACGIHYDFNASGEAVDNIVERLVFFGGSLNPFIDYRATADTVSIDPTATMNGDGTTSSNACTLGCYAYTSSLRDTCCSCDGKQGTFRPAPWDRKMLYCAY